MWVWIQQQITTRLCFYIVILIYWWRENIEKWRKKEIIGYIQNYLQGWICGCRPGNYVGPSRQRARHRQTRLLHEFLELLFGLVACFFGRWRSWYPSRPVCAAFPLPFPQCHRGGASSVGTSFRDDPELRRLFRGLCKVKCRFQRKNYGWLRISIWNSIAKKLPCCLSVSVSVSVSISMTSVSADVSMSVSGPLARTADVVSWSTTTFIFAGKVKFEF